MDINVPTGASEKNRYPSTRSESGGSEWRVTSAANLHSVKDLKEAELRGENIPVSEEQFIKAIERAIKSIEGASTFLEFSVHKETKQILVKVLNKETGELIREIPPEKNLDLIAKIWEMAGIIIDEKKDNLLKQELINDGYAH